METIKNNARVAFVFADVNNNLWIRLECLNVLTRNMRWNQS